MPTADGLEVVAFDTAERLLATARRCRRCLALVDPWGLSYAVLGDAERAAGLGLVALVPKRAGLEAICWGLVAALGSLDADGQAADGRVERSRLAWEWSLSPRA